ncbi:MAG: ArsR family transcriptional regulator [Desulfovermiculus sp.]|nr:ArsR family transcriptional regulator [Desulfovermiculus sp.]
MEELCVCQITELLRLATATVSRHMSILQNAEDRKNLDTILAYDPEEPCKMQRQRSECDIRE